MQEGRLRFLDSSVSGDVLAECTGCGKCFKESWEGEAGTSKAIKRIKERYKTHNCSEDFSRAQARGATGS
jgi:hypothetical protein